MKLKFSNEPLLVRTDGRDRAAEFFGFDPKLVTVEPHSVDERGIVWAVYPPEAEQRAKNKESKS